MALFMAIVSGLTGALFSLGYKYRRALKADDAQLTFLLALFTALLSLAGIAIAQEPLFERSAVLLGAPFGIATFLSIYFFLSIIDRAQLNTSWTIIQFFVLIPFAMSVVAYGEKLDLAGVIGVLLIFGAILLFGLGSRTDARRARADGRGAATDDRGDPVRVASPDRRALIVLLASTLFSGIGNCVPKIYTAAAPATHVFTLTFWGNFWFAACGIVAIVRRAAAGRLRPNRGSIVIAGWMAGTSLVGTALLIVALTRIPGAVAFPVRSIVNTVTVYFLSFALFRERLTPVEGAGAVVAVAGIALVSSSVA